MRLSELEIAKMVPNYEPADLPMEPITGENDGNLFEVGTGLDVRTQTSWLMFLEELRRKELESRKLENIALRDLQRDHERRTKQAHLSEERRKSAKTLDKFHG